MPFLDDTPETFAPLRPAPREVEPTTSLWESAYRSESGLAAMNETLDRPIFKPQEGFRLAEARSRRKEIFDRYPAKFNAVQSDEEFDFIADRAEQGEKDEARIVQAGLGGLVAAVGASLVSPAVLLPIVGGYGTAARVGGVIGAAAGGAALDEAFLQSTNPARSTEMGVASVAGAFVIGSILGGAGALLSRAQMDRAVRGLTEDNGWAEGSLTARDLDRIQRSLNEPESVGAAQVPGPSAAQPLAGVAPDNLIGRAVQRTVGRGLAEVSPPLRSQDKLTRREYPLTSIALVTQNISTAGVKTANRVNPASPRGMLEPTARGGQLEHVALFKERLANARINRVMSDAWSSYVTGAETPGLLARAAASVQGVIAPNTSRSGRLSYAEWSREFARAMNFDDVSEIPSVAKAAKELRVVIDEITKEAQEVGLLKGVLDETDLKGSTTYLSHVYDHAAVTRLGGEFVEDIIAHTQPKLIEKWQNKWSKTVEKIGKLQQKLDNLKLTPEEAAAKQTEARAKIGAMSVGRTAQLTEFARAMGVTAKQFREKAKTLKGEAQQKALAEAELLARDAEAIRAANPDIAEFIKTKARLQRDVSQLNKTVFALEGQARKLVDKADAEVEASTAAIVKVSAGIQRTLGKLDRLTDEQLDGEMLKIIGDIEKLDAQWAKAEEALGRLTDRFPELTEAPDEMFARVQRFKGDIINVERFERGPRGERMLRVDGELSQREALKELDAFLARPEPWTEGRTPFFKGELEAYHSYEVAGAKLPMTPAEREAAITDMLETLTFQRQTRGGRASTEPMPTREEAEELLEQTDGFTKYDDAALPKFDAPDEARYGSVFGDGNRVYIDADGMWARGEVDRMSFSNTALVTARIKNGLVLTPDNVAQVFKSSGIRANAENAGKLFATWTENNGHDALIIRGFGNEKVKVAGVPEEFFQDQVVVFNKKAVKATRRVTQEERATYVPRGEAALAEIVEAAGPTRNPRGWLDVDTPITPAMRRSVQKWRDDIAGLRWSERAALAAAEVRFDRAVKQQFSRSARLANKLTDLEVRKQFDRVEARQTLTDLANAMAARTAETTAKRAVRASKLRERAVKIIEEDLPAQRTAAARLEDEIPNTREDFIEMAKAAGAREVDPENGVFDFSGRLREDAGQILNTILRNDVRSPVFDILQDIRGPEKARMLDLPYEVKEKYLVTDPNRILKAWVRTIVPDVEIARRFGDTSLSKWMGMGDEAGAITAERDELLRLIQNDLAPDGTPLPQPRAQADKDRLVTEVMRDFEQGKRDIQTMLARMRHTDGLPANPRSIAYRTAKGLLNYNVPIWMGNVLFASIMDPARVVMKHGLTSAMRENFIPMVANFKQWAGEMSDVARQAGRVAEDQESSRLMAFADVAESNQSYSRVERFLEYTALTMGRVSGAAYWTNLGQMMAGVMSNSEFMHALEKVMSNAGPMGRDRALNILANAGFDDELAGRVWNQLEATGFSRYSSGTLNPRIDQWTDAGARDAYLAFLSREIDNTIITPGQERPAFMSSNIAWRLIMQFRSFGMAANTKILMAGLQQRDAAVLQGVVASLALGAASYYFWALQHGTDSKQFKDMMDADPARWADEAIYRSGMLAGLSEVQALLSDFPLTHGLVNFSDTGAARLRNRDARETLFGVSTGTLDNMQKFLQGIDDPTQATASAARKLMLYQNVFYLRWLFTQVEKSAGLPESR